MITREWVLRRNCSTSPRQLLSAFAVLCLVSLVVAAFFVLRGAWVVFEFAVLELLAVGWAFLQYACHATDRERIALSDDCLLVELVQGECIRRQFKLDRRRLCIQEPSSHHGLICLESNGTQVEIGRFLTECRRHEFAQELRCAIVSNG